MQEVVGADRHHDVDLKITGLSSNRDRGVVAHYLRADHSDRLSNDWIHLAGHNRTSRLHSGQIDFANAGTGTGTEPANIIGNFHETDCQCIQRTTGLHNAIESALSLEVVTSFTHGDAVYL